MIYRFIKQTRFRYVANLVFLVGFVLSTLSLNLLMVAKASAQELQGEWVDRATILIGNDVYRDSDPFDDNNEWLGADQGGGCFAKLTLTLGASLGTVSRPTRNSIGECLYNNPNQGVVLTKESERWVTAYRLNENAIFMPVCRVPGDPPFTEIGTFIRMNHDQKSNCTFNRAPSDASFYKDNIYTLGGSFDVTGDQGGSWVDTSSMLMYAKSCSTLPVIGQNLCVKLGDGTTTIIPVSIGVDGDPLPVVLANGGAVTQPNPKAGYQIGNNTNPDEVNGTSTPTCESNNGTVVIGWILCAILGVLDNTVDASTNLVNNLLEFNTENLKSGNNAEQLKAAWGVFRVISSFALVAVVLVMVIGQALGGGN